MPPCAAEFSSTICATRSTLIATCSLAARCSCSDSEITGCFALRTSTSRMPLGSTRSWNGGKVAGVIVDYIHLLSEPGVDNEVQRIAAITRGLKQLAMDFKVPIIALSQLNRQVSGRENPRPNLGDLRGSGAIEQDGDCVIFLYKDTSEGEAAMNRTINVYVGKNRQGASFIDFPLEWQGDFVRAVDMMPGA